MLADEALYSRLGFSRHRPKVERSLSPQRLQNSLAEISEQEVMVLPGAEAAAAPRATSGSGSLPNAAALPESRGVTEEPAPGPPPERRDLKGWHVLVAEVRDPPERGPRLCL